jgi:disulfide bond formation protein DsbB
VNRLNVSAVLWAVAVLSFAAVGVAVFTQVQFDWRPCPWCILQRVLFVAIGILSAVGALWKSRGPVKLLSAVSVLFALCGIASALYQNLVASKSSSCNLTFADKVVTGLGVDKLLPSVFQVTGSCAEAAVSVLGVPYEFWSLLLFVVIGAALIAVLRQPARR